MHDIRSRGDRFFARWTGNTVALCHPNIIVPRGLVFSGMKRFFRSMIVHVTTKEKKKLNEHSLQNLYKCLFFGWFPIIIFIYSLTSESLNSDILL